MLFRSVSIPCQFLQKCSEQFSRDEPELFRNFTPELYTARAAGIAANHTLQRRYCVSDAKDDHLPVRAGIGL